MFLFCQLKKDNGLIDIWWGLGFAAVNLSQVATMYQQGMQIDNRTIITNICTALWGLRLALHIGKRHKPEEDYRYVAMRERWMARGGKKLYYFSAYMYIFIM
jgi:steroid 5-alpha reductase family enzyme